MRTRRLLIVAFVLSIVAPACGDSDASTSDTTQSSDTSTGGDTVAAADTTGGDVAGGDTVAADTAGGDTTGGDSTGGDTVASTCTETGFTAVAQDAGTAFGAFRYVAQTTITPGEPVSVLTFELIPGDGAETVGTYELTDDNYADCGNCITLSKNCDDGLANCEKAFLVQSGTLDITSFGASGGTFSGTLTNAVFAEATFADDFTSTLVPNGDSWCIGSFSFSATVQ